MRRASLPCRSRRSAVRTARACLAAGLLAVGVHPVVSIAGEITPQTLRLVERDVRGVLPRASAATVGIGGSGSGVIVTPDGYVLTVHHAAPKDDATVTLVLGDGRNVSAKVLGGDKATDTRVLKIIDKGPWPFVAMAETDLELAVGEWGAARPPSTLPMGGPLRRPWSGVRTPTMWCCSGWMSTAWMWSP
jgi:S1-C subfamily serine protease